jgi:YCII-related domain
MKYLLLIQQFGPRRVGALFGGREGGDLRRLQGDRRDPWRQPRPSAAARRDVATTVRMQDGKTLTTDGLFVAVKEALGGYLVFEADDLDAAIELAARIPQVSRGGAIEVRPAMEG